MKKLTQKQEMFCLAYMETGNASEAYRRSFSTSNMKDKTVTEKASRLMADGNIRARVDFLREQVEDEGILTSKEIQKMLSERAKEELNGDGLKAIDILNKMGGNYEKDNHQKAPVQQVNNFNSFYDNEEQ